MTGRLRQPQAHLQIIGKLSAEHRSDNDSSADPVKCCHTANLSNRCIGSLKQHELEWISSGDLLGGNFVTPPIVGKAANETADTCHRVPGARPGGIEGPGKIPAIGWHRSHHRFSTLEQFQERIRRQGPGHHAANADDGNRSVVGIIYSPGSLGCHGHGGGQGRRRQML